jgi:hypothetical protein
MKVFGLSSLESKQRLLLGVLSGKGFLRKLLLAKLNWLI